MSICGSIPEFLTSNQKSQLLDTLDIHSKCILHNDIELQNILVNELDKLDYLIDVGFSSQSTSVDAHERERELLVKCFDSR